MNSFRFPGPPTGERDRHSEPLSPSTDGGAPQQGSLISSSDEILPAPAAAEERSPLQYSIMADAGRDDYAGKADKRMAESNIPHSHILSPSSVEVKRAPVPLGLRRGSSCKLKLIGQTVHVLLQPLYSVIAHQSYHPDCHPRRWNSRSGESFDSARKVPET